MRTVAAIFDVDRTLIRFPTERLFFAYLLWRRTLPPAQAGRFLLNLWRRPAGRYTDKSYLCGLRADLVQELARECYHRLIRPRLSPVGLARLREHQRLGHQTVILTGSLELLIQPLHQELRTDWLIATRLETLEGHLTGRIVPPHPRGRHKLTLLEELARRGGFDLAQSYAYADHRTDLPLLEGVGHPVVVNPSRALHTVARRRGWPICRF